MIDEIMRRSISLNLSKKLLQNEDKIASVESFHEGMGKPQVEVGDLRPDAEDIARGRNVAIEEVNERFTILYSTRLPWKDGNETGYGMRLEALNAHVLFTRRLR